MSATYREMRFMSGNWYFRDEMSRKFCEGEMREYGSCHLALLTIHWKSLKWHSGFEKMAIHTIHCIRCTLQQSCAQINLAWLELTFHLKKVWDHDIFRFCWPFQMELLPPQWMLDVFLWLFSHGPGFNHCDAFGNKKQCQYF